MESKYPRGGRRVADKMCFLSVDLNLHMLMEKSFLVTFSNDYSIFLKQFI